MIEIIYVLIVIGFFIDDITNDKGEYGLIFSVIVAVAWPIILGVKISKLRETIDDAKQNSN